MVIESNDIERVFHMVMAWYDVYKDFNSLMKKEQLELFKLVQQDLLSEPKSDISKMVGEVREKTIFTSISMCLLR